MKVVVLRTYTNDMERIWRSLDNEGHEVASCIKYDEMDHGAVMDVLYDSKPELIVYIGALAEFHAKPVPSIGHIHEYGSIAPVVHICPDAGEPVWWPVLEAYKEAKCFSLQVGIDGYKDAHGDVVPLLAPVDKRLFSPKPWNDRSVDLGLVGAFKGTFSTAILRYSSAHHKARWMGNGTYEEIATFLCDCKMVANVALNSKEDGAHITPLVSDIAAAGACLLESKNDETKKWFNSDTFYEYEDFKGVAALLKLELPSERPEKKASMLNRRFNDYKPFWKSVIGLL